MSSPRSNMARPPRHKGQRFSSLFVKNHDQSQDTPPPALPSGIKMARPIHQSENHLTLILIIAFSVVALTTLVLAGLMLFNTLFPAETPLQGNQANPPTEKQVVIPMGAQYEKPLDAGGFVSKAWNGTDRVNVLVMGLDYRDGEDDNGASRTDSMILFTMDPASKTAGMLSIPRDLSVTIPGYGEAKLNTAYFLGAIYKEKGGGPGLAVQTVENFLKAPINYYMVINWDAFVKFIDSIGGVDIKVPAAIKVGIVKSGHSIIIRPGTQTMNGETALAYARARDTDHGDFDRSRRQQQVIMAVRDNIFNYYTLPKLVSKAPALLELLKDGVKTNMSLQEAVILALAARNVPEKSILREVINEDEQVYATFNTDGQYVLVPIPEAMQKMRDKLFNAPTANPAAKKPGAAGPKKDKATPEPAAQKPLIIPTDEPLPTPTLDPNAVLIAEAAKISVQNGTGVSGLASSTAEMLKRKGLNVVEETNAADLSDFTEIHYGSAKPETIKRLSALLKVQPSRVYNQNIDAGNNADVVVILGADWANSQ